MKPNKEAHMGASLKNVKLKTNPTQECVVNGEKPTWQVPETELTDPNPASTHWHRRANYYPSKIYPGLGILHCENLWPERTSP
ncbi:hypothetical protein E2C01_042191 [Portunus trituberculatus]|uniref:Uncharacterized protein n=1 Tax=Portunus trituberculatus TaxID=210409 RepID=A0A5B7FL42_PORTR|nr:hypothetical protein [Portunus trituberculatus]